MIKKHLNLVTIGIILLIVGTIYFVRKDEGQKISDAILDKNLIVDSLDDVISNALRLFLASTKYEDKWQINKKLNKNYVNVFVIKNSNNALLQKFSNNCSLIGIDNILIINYDFVKGFIHSHLNDNYERKIEFNSVQFEGFIYWVMGHELGHLTMNHGQSHFEKNSLEDLVPKSNYNQSREIQADSFSISKIVNHSDYKGKVTFLLLDFLNSEIQNKTKRADYHGVGLVYNFYSQPAITYSKKQTHPEYIIRAVRALEIIGKQTNDTGLIFQLEKLVENFKVE